MDETKRSNMRTVIATVKKILPFPRPIEDINLNLFSRFDHDFTEKPWFQGLRDGEKCQNHNFR